MCFFRISKFEFRIYESLPFLFISSSIYNDYSMYSGYHSHRKRRNSVKSKSDSQDVLKKTADGMVYIFGTFSALVYVPQLLQIWIEKNVAGISLLSWLGMLTGSLFWIFYGIVHKEKPILFINLIGSSIMLFVVIGILIYR
jgi:uncharacterized protein with PQ loop repeat